MEYPRDIAHDLVRLWHHIESRRRSQFGVLLLLMIVVSFAEIVSIGAVIPFLAVLSSPAQLFGHPAAQPAIRWLGFTSPDQLLLPLTIAFGLAALFAGAMRLVLLWASTRVSFATGADLSVNIYRRTLFQPYSVHIARNSSEVISGIVHKTDTVTSDVALVLTFISSSIMLVTIMAALLSIDSRVALAAFAGFGFIYGVIGRVTHRKLLLDSRRVAHEANQVIKALQEGLGGIRDVLLYGSQATCCQTFRNADLPLRHARGNNVIIGASPRYLMEALGMALIAFLAYMLTRNSERLSTAIPVLGALALGAQRLLPALQQAYGAWSGIQGGRAALRDTLDLLDQPLPEHANQPPAKPIPFSRQIGLHQVSFRYGPDLPLVFENVNLSIAKGSRVGFIGVTGSGKSTLLDILMGLLSPTGGHIAIDGQPIGPANQRSWQVHIAHVAQDIFLSDNSIEENIAFGVPKDQIDPVRIRSAARQAQISGFIDDLPQGYLTIVGERGVRLSGGQRQRIGIARALYRNADVIIFDEATSALDSETEQAVMQSIETLDKDLTVLIIAHRLSTLRNCTQIVDLDSQGNLRVIRYDEIAAQSA
jgi:ABC-type multidrug transport system fused ATPase/permease subunit